jgi:hypothetical protein
MAYRLFLVYELRETFMKGVDGSREEWILSYGLGHSSTWP